MYLHSNDTDGPGSPVLLDQSDVQQKFNMSS